MSLKASGWHDLRGQHAPVVAPLKLPVVQEVVPGLPRIKSSSRLQFVVQVHVLRVVELAVEAAWAPGVQVYAGEPACIRLMLGSANNEHEYAARTRESCLLVHGCGRCRQACRAGCGGMLPREGS